MTYWIFKSVICCEFLKVLQYVIPKIVPSMQLFLHALGSKVAVW